MLTLFAATCGVARHVLSFLYGVTELTLNVSLEVVGEAFLCTWAEVTLSLLFTLKTLLIFTHVLYVKVGLV